MEYVAHVRASIVDSIAFCTFFVHRMYVNNCVLSLDCSYKYGKDGWMRWPVARALTLDFDICLLPFLPGVYVDCVFGIIKYAWPLNVLLANNVRFEAFKRTPYLRGVFVTGALSLSLYSHSPKYRVQKKVLATKWMCCERRSGE